MSFYSYALRRRPVLLEGLSWANELMGEGSSSYIVRVVRSIEHIPTSTLVARRRQRATLMARPTPAHYLEQLCCYLSGCLKTRESLGDADFLPCTALRCVAHGISMSSRPRFARSMHVIIPVISPSLLSPLSLSSPLSSLHLSISPLSSLSLLSSLLSPSLHFDHA